GLVAVMLVFGGVCLAVALSDGPVLPVAGAFAVLAVVAVLAAGGDDTLPLARGPRGALLLTPTAHLCFFPAWKKMVDLGQCEAIQIDAGNSPTSMPAPPWGSVVALLLAALLFGWVGLFLMRHRTAGGVSGGDSTTGSTSFAVHLLSRP